MYVKSISSTTHFENITTFFFFFSFFDLKMLSGTEPLLYDLYT